MQLVDLLSVVASLTLSASVVTGILSAFDALPRLALWISLAAFTASAVVVGICTNPEHSQPPER